MKIAYAFVLDIPRANVDAADSLTKRPCRNVCKTVCCICFPAYVG